MRLALIVSFLLAFPATAAQHIAVLELKNRLPAKQRGQFPADYFTDQIRAGALHAADPQRLQIISRENLLVLLKSSGRSLEECEGECEVDTGKRIGADFVISGELVMVGSTVKASLRLHDTQEGTLLSAVTASGRTPEELDKSLADSLDKLLEPVKKAAAAPPPPKPQPQAAAAAKPPQFVLARASGPSTLAQLPDLTAAAEIVASSYYDKSRVDPQKMVDGALAALAAVSSGAVEMDATSLRAGGKSIARPRATELSKVVPALQAVGSFVNSAMPPGSALLQGAAGEWAEGAGMLQALDARSTVITPAVYAEMKVATRGNFGGLGIVVQIKDGRLQMNRVLPGAPAARAGLQPGDRITSIDGKPTEGVELDDAVKLMRGPPGSKVSLVIERGGKRVPVDLARAVITVDPVRSVKMSGNVGYLRLESFQANAAAKIKEAFTSMGELRGLVFDLRGNGGGLLAQAEEICDLFMDSGAIYAAVGADMHEEKKAKSGDAGESVPLVVLVDGASGSATEITAGALRYNARTILVGAKTAGRGTVQTLHDLPDGAALKLTVAQYLVAGVHAVEGAGIPADVEREARFDEDPEKDSMVTFARQVLLRSKSASRDDLLAAARQ